MPMIIQPGHELGKHNVFICFSLNSLQKAPLNAAEFKYAKRQHGLKKDLVVFNRYDKTVFVVFVNPELEINKRLEQCRKIGSNLCNELNNLKINEITISDIESHCAETLALAEGIALSNYQFLRYRKDEKDKKNSLSIINLLSNSMDASAIEKLSIVVEAVNWARDLVNEPVNKLNATKIAEVISQQIQSVGARAEIFNKSKLEALKMGGLLSVNLGSVDPPTFTVLKWKPDNAINDNPIILVGKGVVYDTGGLSLKPSKSMDTMKCDMAGSAVVAAAVYAVAKAKLPVHLMALIPATDNRPGGNAYVPGDVITMFDGTTVEVLNTDAEGRLILADALSYAKKFNPKLVINIATLTGSAANAIGSHGIVVMEKDADETFKALEKNGLYVHERLVRFPLWDEYLELLKSEIADLKNIGGVEAGAITAGKFLEHFTNYPFIHMDIAGPAFIESRDGYRTKGGTGTGVRLLFDFFSKML